MIETTYERLSRERLADLYRPPTFTVATPASGALQVHRDGCQHLARLFAEGGGVLSDGHVSVDRAVHVAHQDCDRVDILPCTGRKEV